MGEPISTAALMVVGGGLQLKAGLDAKKEAKRQAEINDKETKLKADMNAMEAEKFRARQRMQYLKSGVQLEGSPLLVLEESERLAQIEQQAILDSGTARSDSLKAQGRSRMWEGIGNMMTASAKGVSTLR